MTMYGISDAREIWNSRYSKKGHWFYDVEMIGSKANMTDICAALGIHQLRKLNLFNATRRKYALLYCEGLKDTGCQFLEVKEGDVCSWHLFPLLLPINTNRDELILQLKDDGIGTSVLFRPLHLHSAYSNLLSTQKGDFPVSERIFERLVNLPISPSVSQSEIEYIIDRVKNYI